jgi:GH24 family phage-related lysozyme (muramidase)
VLVLYLGSIRKELLEMDPEFERLLLKENAALLSGETDTSTSYWDNTHFSVGFGTPSYKGEVVNKEEAMKRAEKHFAAAREQAKLLLPEDKWKKLSNERRGVLSRMVYQMGTEGVAKFEKTLGAIASEDYAGAADEMLRSKWYKQTPERAFEESEIMRGLHQ